MNDWIEEAHALADGELTGEDKDRAEAWIARDTAARREFEWAQTLRTTLQTKCAPTADPGLAVAWKQSLERLDAIDRGRKAERFVGRYAWAMCGVFLAVILSVGAFNRLNPSDQMSEAHLASVFSGLNPRPTPPVAEPRQVREIVRQNAGRVAVGRTDDLVLVGAASRIIDGRRAARFDFQRMQGAPVTLFVIGGTVSLAGMTAVHGRPGMSAGAVNGANCVIWRDLGQTLILVGECALADLVAVAAELRRSQ